VVRAGTGWPKVGVVAAEADSAAAGRADSNSCTRGGGEGSPLVYPANGERRAQPQRQERRRPLLLVAHSATRGRSAPSHGRQRRGARSRRLRRRFRLSRKDQIATGVSAGAVNANLSATLACTADFWPGRTCTRSLGRPDPIRHSSRSWRSGSSSLTVRGLGRCPYRRHGKRTTLHRTSHGE